MIFVFRSLAVRAVIASVSLLAMAWGVLNFSGLATEARLYYVATRIKETEPYKFPVVQELAEEKDGNLPGALHADAVIKERLLEMQLLAGKRLAIDAGIDGARESAILSLSVAPYDSFLWLTLYWLKTVEGGLSPKNIELLRMSYATGRNEGWIAIRRNRLAFIVYPYLPADIATRTNAEFVALVRNQFTDEAANILVGPAWAERDALLASLETVPEEQRQRLADKLYDMGYRLEVPGIRRSEDRPWHKYQQ